MTRLHQLLRGNDDVRAGVVVLLASLVGHAGNYLYYVVAARLLGPAQFAEVSAIVAYSLIALQPLGGVQAAAARDVARARAVGGTEETSGIVQGLLRWVGVTSALTAVVLLAVSPLITYGLSLDSWTLSALAAVWIALGAVLVVGTGVLQGLGSFGRVAVVLAGPSGMLRTLFLVPLVLWIGLTGSIWAMVLATAVGIALLVSPVRRIVAVRVPRLPFRPGTPVVMLLAFASLTNADVLASKAAFDAVTAGAYSAAALMGKIALYAPAALTVVLLPRASSAVATGGSAARPVLVTTAVTAFTGLAIAGVYALVPDGLLASTFGRDFTRSASLLVPLALVMTLAAVLFVHLTFAIARNSRRFPVLVVAAAAAQALLLAIWHDSPGQVVAVTAAVLSGSLLAVEVGSRYGLVRMVMAELGG